MKIINIIIESLKVFTKKLNNLFLIICQALLIASMGFSHFMICIFNEVSKASEKLFDKIEEELRK